VLPDTSAQGGQVVAEKLRQALAQRPLLDDHPELTLTLTVGIAEMTPDITAEESVRHADHALVTGKTSGKDRVVTWSEGQRS
jgi:PleD family two-component response regulator